jgi:hypothetical protein
VCPDREVAMQRVEEMIASEMAVALRDWEHYRVRRKSG